MTSHNSAKPGNSADQITAEAAREIGVGGRKTTLARSGAMREIRQHSRLYDLVLGLATMCTLNTFL